MKIVGICGRSRHGKNTIADVFVEHGYERVSFAYLVRVASAALYDVPLDTFMALSTGPDKEKPSPLLHGKSPRDVLVRVGMTARGMFGRDVWVDALFSTLAESRAYVIDDVRFRNEIEAIQHHGGEVVFVHRPSLAHLPVSPADSDVADIYHEHPEWFVINNGTISGLRSAIEYRYF